MLNSRGGVYWPRVPQFGQGTSDRSSSVAALPVRSVYSSASWSARNRLWQLWHSTSGSWNALTCPEATQTWRGRITELSRPTTSSRPVTTVRHHCRLMFSFSSTPSGP
jgi:hypothetical protein